MYKVHFVTEQLTIEVVPGTMILDAEIAAGLEPDAPCGGMGACGKCAVTILSPEGGQSKVLACTTPVTRDLEILTAGQSSHRILTEGTGTLQELAPPIRAAVLDVKRATLDSPTSDWHRLSEAAEAALGTPLRADPSLADGLGARLTALQYRPEAIVWQDELLCLREPGPLLTAAVDIGTTTVVLYLADAGTGEVLCTRSTLNPQTEFGADVISRANYAMEHGAQRAAAVIRGAVNRLLAEALTEVGAAAESVFSMVIVGNTCMHHLFLGIDPTSLVLSPYVPSLDEPLTLRAADWDIAIHPRGKLFLLPCIAGFVGADTASVMVACEFDRREQLTLAIDIGTNGELVIGDRRRTAACSTAAGPAFEGAKITFGMRGAEGAIDHADIRDGRFTCSVIGGGQPRGICGSGLLDITAALLRAGVLDETGRFADEDDLPPEAAALAARLRTIDGQRCFVLAEEAGSAADGPIYLSQKDVREVQLAKGAMAAGIQLLLEHLGRRVEDVQEVLIAGAFGNFMSPESACAIGLIPTALRRRIKAVGNAAGSGALLCALNSDNLERAANMVRNTEFLELASNPAFQDRFVEELMFPEEEDA